MGILPPYGNYTIKEVNQSGYRPTLRAGGVNITIDDVQNHWMNIDFGNQPLGNISGYKVDSNGNPLANWNISISNVTYPYFNSTLTDANGAFNFTDVPVGVYWLNETTERWLDAGNAKPNCGNQHYNKGFI